MINKKAFLPHGDHQMSQHWQNICGVFSTRRAVYFHRELNAWSHISFCLYLSVFQMHTLTNCVFLAPFINTRPQSQDLRLFVAYVPSSNTQLALNSWISLIQPVPLFLIWVQNLSQSNKLYPKAMHPLSLYSDESHWGMIETVYLSRHSMVFFFLQSNSGSGIDRNNKVHDWFIRMLQSKTFAFVPFVAKLWSVTFELCACLKYRFDHSSMTGLALAQLIFPLYKRDQNKKGTWR